MVGSVVLQFTRYMLFWNESESKREWRDCMVGWIEGIKKKIRGKKPWKQMCLRKKKKEDRV